MNANLNISISNFIFKGKKKEFLDWLESLKISKYWLDTMNQPDCFSLCKEIYQVLKNFSAIDLIEKERLFCLFEIDSCLQGIYKNLHEGHLNEKLPLTSEKQEYVDLIIHTHLALAKAYYRIMLDRKAQKNEISDHYLALTSCKAFQGLGTVFLTSAEIYINPPKGFWLLNYGIFNIIESLNLLDNKVRIDDTIYSPAVLFKKMIVFYIIDKNKCSPAEIDKVFHALLRGINHIESNILTIEDMSVNVTPKIFGFSLNKDEPPTVQSNIPIATAKLLRYVENQEVIKILQFLIHEIKLHPQASFESPKILNHLLLTLEFQKYKRQTRINKKHKCRAIIGLDDLVSFLLEKEEKKHFTPKKNIIPYKDDFDSLQILWDCYSEKNSPENNLVFDDLEIIDSSMEGYGIFWNNPVAAKLQIGDAIGIIPAFNSVINKIEIGLIRRMTISADNIRFGVELIGLESTLIHITKNNSDTANWELFLFGLPNYDIGILCHKEHHYRTGETVFVELPKKKISCHLGEIFNSTPLLDHIGLSY